MSAWQPDPPPSGRTDSPRERGLGRSPAEWDAVARRLAAERTRSGVLERIVELAVEVVPTAEQVSVSVAGHAGLATVAASGAPARQLDAVQTQVGQGPCIAAMREDRVFVVPDLAAEDRWPRFTARLAQPTWVRSMLSLPLRASSTVTGSVNLSSAAIGAFTGCSGTGSLFAALPAMALAAVEERHRAAGLAERVARAEGFLAVLAHDLRSGMTVALSARDLLNVRRRRLDVSGQEALDLLTDELDRLQWLLHALLGLARAQTDHSPSAPTALLPVIRDVVEHHRRPVPVHAGSAAAASQVDLDPSLVRTILVNVLDNADRHAGGATAIRVGVSGEQAWVAVEDAGPGIPLERREDAFTRFGLGVAASHGKGVHLGLALSREHARRVGGDLRIEDRPGGGSRFLLLLPTSDAPAPTASTEDRAAPT